MELKSIWQISLSECTEYLSTEIEAKRKDRVLRDVSNRSGDKVEKLKRGLPGFINGSSTSALADTGTLQNVVSEKFAGERGLVAKGKSTVFRLGNSKTTRSIGTVNVRWAFEEKLSKLYDIECHVLPQCTYDLILGSKFLTATETFSKHRHRVANCLFSMSKVFHLNFLGGGRQIIGGKVGGYLVNAIPDSGAERNVMSLNYAKALGFKISKLAQNRGLLQFADGSIQETVGQVHTTWTFTSGLKIPVSFEVLENCSAGVILGEHVLWEHNVFQTYASSIRETPYQNGEDEVSDLAPFSYEKGWQQTCRDIKHRIKFNFNRRTHGEEPSEDETLELIEMEERRRRDQWTHQYGFEGVRASPAEKAAEDQRREDYNARRDAFRRRPPRQDISGSPTPSASPHATNSHQVDRLDPNAEPTTDPPVIPSIPTAPAAQ